MVGIDLFLNHFAPPDGPMPFFVWSDRYCIYAYALPDGGRLLRHLEAVGHFPEENYFIGRLREAIAAWQELVEQAVIIVIRNVVEGTVSDEEIIASMKSVPEWL